MAAMVVSWMMPSNLIIIQIQGLTTETNYPYQGTQGTCSENAIANPAATITGYEDVPADNETALVMADANQPVSGY